MDNILNIDTLKAGKHAVKVIDWPGTNKKIGITVLTDQEFSDAHFAVEQVFKKNGVEFSAATVDLYTSEQNTQILARALVHPENRHKNGDPVRFFSSADELRELLAHQDVKAELNQEYKQWQNDCSPMLSEMTEEEFDRLFNDTKKNSAVLSDLSTNNLKGLIIYLADRQQKLPGASGSTSP